MDKQHGQQKAIQEWEQFANSIAPSKEYEVETKEEKPYYKVIITNHVVEVYEIEREPFNPHELETVEQDAAHFRDADMLAYNKETGSINLSLRQEAIEKMRQQQKEEREDKELRKIDRKAERRAQTLRDARNKCRRLAIANFNEESIFMTLTFADNMSDVSYADNEFKKFNKRLKDRYGSYDYIAVREFQKRGAVHYHIVCNVPFNWHDKKQLQALEREIGENVWKHGFVDIQRMNNTKRGQNVDNVGAYLTKYMSKEFDDSRLQGKKAYLNSKGLVQPIVITGDAALKLVEEYKNKKETFTNAYANEYLGKITYREFNLLRK